MVSVVIYGLIAISLAAAAGYAFLTFTSTTRQTIQLQENVARLETATAALRSSLRALNGNGVLFAPMGQVKTDGLSHSYMQLPNTLGVVGAAPWGQPYLYCPLSQTGTANPLTSSPNASSGPVVEPSGASYTTATYADATTSGLPYVITSPTNVVNGSQTGYIAFIVSSLGAAQIPPDCSQITVGANGPSVSNGIVRGVTSGFTYSQRTVASIDRTELYVGSSTSGDGSGQDASDLTTLPNAVALWKALQPRQTIIYLEGGATYGLSDDLDAEDVRPYAEGESTSLLIATDPASTSVATLTITGALALTTPTTFQNLAVSVSSAISTVRPLTLKSISMSGPGGAPVTISSYGAPVMISDSNLTNLTLAPSNGNLEFYNTSTTATSLSGIQIVANAANVSFNAKGSGTYNLSNTNSLSVLNATLGGISVASNTTVQIVDNTAGVSLVSANLNVAGALTYTGSSALGGINALDNSGISVPVGGSVQVSQSSGALPYGIYLRGSRLALDGRVKTVGIGTSALFFQEGSLVGSTTGSIIVPSAAYPCVAFYSFNFGSTNRTIPLYLSTSAQPANYAGYPTFAQAQYGFPPLVTYNGATAVNTIDTATAGAIVPGTSVTGNDPAIQVNTIPTPPTTYYVTGQTFEAGVRAVVNSEFATGININFPGTCGP